MKATLILFALIFTAMSCGITKNSTKGLNKIKFSGTTHIPYCGGAKPSPDVAAGYYESMKFETFKLFTGKDFSNASTAIQEVKLDEGGNIELNLPNGTYTLVRTDKYLSLDEFKKKNGIYEPKLFKVKEDACFETWMNTPDLTFTVVNDTIIELRKRAKCWVGTNPCIEYVGPPAP
jgi:hypothetical protein